MLGKAFITVTIFSSRNSSNCRRDLISKRTGKEQRHGCTKPVHVIYKKNKGQLGTFTKLSEFRADVC